MTKGEIEASAAAFMSSFPSFQSLGGCAFNPGLDRIRELCGLMGNPQNSVPCIHVAGTNGKGSTSNMLAACFASCGLRVGLYTSPHLLDFRERIRIVGNIRTDDIIVDDAMPSYRLIPAEDVCSFAKQWGKQCRESSLSFFEVTTALAFKWFADQKVDLSILECGLGGRLDATNVVTPELSVITNIAYDHTDILGSTLSLIAAEKAGIIKDAVPVVVGEYGEESGPIFKKVAAEHGSKLVFADREALSGLDGTAFDELLSRMDLQGPCQRKNLRTVLCAISQISGQPGRLPAIPDISKAGTRDAIAATARICGFHGRWERVSDKPVTICDIGHNCNGLEDNFAKLEEMASKDFDSLVIIYGSVRDKDVDGALRLLPEKAKLFLTAASGQRALPPEELFSRLAAIRPYIKAGKEVEICHTVRDAVIRSREYCCTLMQKKSRPLLYIGGSAYLVAEALDELTFPLPEDGDGSHR